MATDLPEAADTVENTEGVHSGVRVTVTRTQTQKPRTLTQDSEYLNRPVAGKRI